MGGRHTHIPESRRVSAAGESQLLLHRMPLSRRSLSDQVGTMRSASAGAWVPLVDGDPPPPGLMQFAPPPPCTIPPESARASSPPGEVSPKYSLPPPPGTETMH